MGRKKTRPIADRKAELLAKLAILEAKENGTYEPSMEPDGLKGVKAALRRRKTALHQAQILIAGRAATDKSPALPGIDAKIENAQKRLDNLLES
jgi:hypothetical protein